MAEPFPERMLRVGKTHNAFEYFLKSSNLSINREHANPLLHRDKGTLFSPLPPG